MATDKKIEIFSPREMTPATVEDLAGRAAPFGLTFFGRIKWDSSRSMVAAYRGYLEEIEQAYDALGAGKQAQANYHATIKFIQEESELHYKADADRRAIAYIEADIARREKEIEQQEREFALDKRKQALKAKRAAFEAGEPEPGTSTTPDTPPRSVSDEEQETMEDLGSIIGASKARLSVENAIIEHLKGRQESDATDIEKLLFTTMRQEVEQMIADRALE